jgi:metallo-beta-lactamase class B
MRTMLHLTLTLTLLATNAALGAKEVVADTPHDCEPCEEWNQPLAPFRVYGNTWFVGTAGLGAILITSDKGHVLIDGGLPQSAPLIAANIRAAGFKIEDIKLILNSHTHYDHAGGIAALQRATGARVAASTPSKAALERGGPTEDDPQFAFGHKHNDYPVVKDVSPVRDGGKVNVGDLKLTAHYTPGHTPGGTSWTWRSCEQGRCLDLVYADSLNSVSAPGFNFSETQERMGTFLNSMKVVESLPCDLLLAPHPVLIEMDAKLARWKAQPAVNPFIDNTACRRYAEAARERLAKRVAEEQAAQ